MRLIKALFVGAAFLAWGLLIALSYGATWGSDKAGTIASISSLLALIYASAAYRRERGGARRKAGRKALHKR